MDCSPTPCRHIQTFTYLIPNGALQHTTLLCLNHGTTLWLRDTWHQHPWSNKDPLPSPGGDAGDQQGVQKSGCLIS